MVALNTNHSSVSFHWNLIYKSLLQYKIYQFYQFYQLELPFRQRALVKWYPGIKTINLSIHLKGAEYCGFFCSHMQFLFCSCFEMFLLVGLLCCGWNLCHVFLVTGHKYGRILFFILLNFVSTTALLVVLLTISVFRLWAWTVFSYCNLLSTLTIHCNGFLFCAGDCHVSAAKCKNVLQWLYFCWRLPYIL